MRAKFISNYNIFYLERSRPKWIGKILLTRDAASNLEASLSSLVRRM
jgi:hypothetical protein